MDLLGKLERVDDVRTIWGSEAGEFTPWLAREENLALLAEAIEIDELHVEGQEVSIGLFRADILCKDALGNHVLIENQIERTNHTHLGQILTYAAGLDAVTIVWIASSFTEEHRAALDWRNRITDERFNFFGLEIEAWRIGNSPAAPKFNIVSKPNNWSKIVATGATDLTDTRRLQFEYWSAFAELVGSRSQHLRPPRPAAEKFTGFPIGRSGFSLVAFVDTADRCIGVGVHIGINSDTVEHSQAYTKAYFHQLQQQKADIEREIGCPLNWLESPQHVRSRIELYRKDTDPADRENWPVQHGWLLEKLEAFQKAFSQRLKSLPAQAATSAQ